MMLSDRALNRALLARQGLLEPWTCSPEQAIERLVGLQAQSPTAPYFGLRSRLPTFEPEQLSRVLLDRTVVRGCEPSPTSVAVTCTPFRRLTRADAASLRAEADRVLAFAAPAARRRVVIV